mgnify:CR=1 FL=1
MTVFTFEIYYDNDMYNTQERYVLAYTEEEAEQKLKTYYKELSKEGYAMPVIIPCATVELENVIV